MGSLAEKEKAQAPPAASRVAADSSLLPLRLAQAGRA